MLENSILWRRDYRPDELDPEYIKPEVIISEKKKERHATSEWVSQVSYGFHGLIFREKIFSKHPIV